MEIHFPLLGSQDDGESFEYLLLSVKETSAEISVPNWLVRRVHLLINEKVELFIPGRLNIEYALRDNVLGNVTHSTPDTNVYSLTIISLS